ncbi:MAG: molecular chaperone HtpG [Oscillospiraceae bacterium]|nr:molecular chaperone HtpG [Oscillospiraceae bacterium]
MAKKQFKAESKRLLDMMINSIYTHREIFLREIISNASDAIDKLCYLSLTDGSVGMKRSDFRIRVSADKENRLLTVSDNGIGMSREDMENNLGVIAHSGSLGFKNDLDEKAADKAKIDIIGQFGVGFYSAFMVSDAVTVISKAYGAETAYMWQSSGTDGYTVTECEKDGVSTDVIMHIKPDAEEDKYSEFLDSWRLQELIKKYSDYVRWPIIMTVDNWVAGETGETDDKGETKKEYVNEPQDMTINSQVPIWQRSKKSVTDDDCKAFYKEKFHDSEDPVAVIRVNAEGTVSYKAMLFIPAKAPYDFYTRDYKPGLQLYSSGVMIMENCADLLPECFRFVRGVVDSPDLSLNISRELLQHDRQLKVISTNLEKKVKSELKKLMDSDPESYEKFWNSFGTQLKYGFVSDYGAKKELIKDLLVYPNSFGEGLISFAGYVEKMPESQKFIYYAAADNAERAAHLPQAEQVLDAGFGLLYMTQDVDAFVVSMMGDWDGKEFCNVSVDDLGLETDMQKADTEKKEEENRSLLDFVKDKLGGEVEAVRLSHKLKTHPVCLTTEGEVTLEVEKYFRSLPNGTGEKVTARKVLEINGEHPAFAALQKAYTEDPDRAEKLAKILLCQAKLIADLPLDNPSEYAELVCALF